MPGPHVDRAGDSSWWTSWWRMFSRLVRFSVPPYRTAATGVDLLGTGTGVAVGSCLGVDGGDAVSVGSGDSGVTAVEVGETPVGVAVSEAGTLVGVGEAEAGDGAEADGEAETGDGAVGVAVEEREHPKTTIPSASSVHMTTTAPRQGELVSRGVASASPPGGLPRESAHRLDALAGKKNRGDDSWWQKQDRVDNHRKPKARRLFHAEDLHYVHYGELKGSDRPRRGRHGSGKKYGSQDDQRD